MRENSWPTARQGTDPNPSGSPIASLACTDARISGAQMVGGSHSTCSCAANPPHSAGIRPRQVPRRSTTEIPDPESVHLPAVQRRATDLPWAAGTSSRHGVFRSLIIPGLQFAYHESSFFLVRLLQAFSSIALAPDAQPLEARPPAEWASSMNSRIRREKIRPKTHLTLYVQVRD